MHLTFRKILLLCSFAIFLIVAPIMILYAVGYRPITTNIPQPVGVILVRANPGKASVSVNNTDYGTLPKSIPNLIPGIADVKITKSGYQPWEKHLEVKAMQATDARSVQLVPVTPDTDTITSNVSQFAVAPDASTIALAHTDNTLTVTDINGKLSTNSIPFASAITRVVWSPDSLYVFVTTKLGTITLIRFANQTIEKIPADLNMTSNTVAWDASQARTLIGITSKRQLSRYSLDKKTLQSIAESVQTFAFLGNELIYQKIDNSLVRQDGTITDTNKRAIEIIPSSHGELAMLFEGGELALMEKSGDIHTIAPHALSAAWSPDGLLLLIQTAPDELNLYNNANDRIRTIPKNELFLLTRLSKQITNPQWYSDSQHILYQSDNTLIFTEIDPRDHVIAYPIGAAPASPITLAKDGTSLLGIITSNATTALTRTWLVTKEDR